MVFPVNHSTFSKKEIEGTPTRIYFPPLLVFPGNHSPLSKKENRGNTNNEYLLLVFPNVIK